MKTKISQVRYVNFFEHDKPFYDNRSTYLNLHINFLNSTFSKRQNVLASLPIKMIAQILIISVNRTQKILMRIKSFGWEHTLIVDTTPQNQIVTIEMVTYRATRMLSSVGREAEDAIQLLYQRSEKILNIFTFLLQ